MVNKKNIWVLSLLLTFMGYCGDGKSSKSDNWLTTSDLQNLVAPAGISATCQSSGHIKVTWDSNYETIATHLQIFRRAVDSEDEFTKIDEIEVGAGIYSNAVGNNIFYKYQVKAIVRGDDGEIQYVSPDFSPQTAQVKATIGCALDGTPSEDQTLPESQG